MINTHQSFSLLRSLEAHFTPAALSASPQDMPSILDWPLPQPSYDEVTAELDDQSEDQEVQSINKRLTLEDAAAVGAAVASRSESQSADLFQELQREVQCSLKFTFHCLLLLLFSFFFSPKIEFKKRYW